MALPRKKLGEILLELGLIDTDQLNSALAHQRQWGMRLGQALVVKGFITEGQLVHVLSRSLGIPLVDLSTVQPDKDAIKLVPPEKCEAQEILPISLEGQKGRRVLVLAMADPLNFAVQEEIGFTTGCKVKPVIASYTSLGQAIRNWVRGDRRVVIQPLMLQRPSQEQAQAPSAPDEEPMVMVARGGLEERVVTSGQAPVRVTPSSPLPLPPLPAAPPPAPAPAGSPYGPAASGQWPTTPHPGYPPAAPTYAYPPAPGPAAAAPTRPPVPGWPAQPSQVPAPAPPPPAPAPASVPPGALNDPVEELEKKFWALMRILARKGIITKDEFLKELGLN
ncbi:MAG: hypothetical protein HY904_17965 [Deltaproteobacteria bacterium]|nr:hypothetical protein [Deltaproteobacteria bacterium]